MYKHELTHSVVCGNQLAWEAVVIEQKNYNHLYE